VVEIAELGSVSQSLVVVVVLSGRLGRTAHYAVFGLLVRRCSFFGALSRGTLCEMRSKA